MHGECFSECCLKIIPTYTIKNTLKTKEVIINSEKG